MKVIITGSSGMVGKGVLIQCLLDDRIDKVLLPNRQPINFKNEKIKEIIFSDLNDLNKYEKEQFAELHKRISNPLYIFVFCLIPLIILRFSKKPGDDLFYPIATISTFAFIFLITQITFNNLLVEQSELIYITYLLPLFFLCIILLFVFFEHINIKGLSLIHI